MGSLESAGGEFAFSASDKTNVKKTPAQFFADFMASRKPVVKLGQMLGQEDAGTAALDPNNASEIADRAREYMKEQADKGVTVSLPEAVAHVGRRT
jgi:hypothetical protein